jgi:Velvet factor
MPSTNPLLYGSYSASIQNLTTKKLNLNFFFTNRFPGMEESTFLSRSFADQGLKIRIRKEIRVRRKQSKRKESLPDPSGQKRMMYSKRPRNSSINQDDPSDHESSDGEFHVDIGRDRQKGQNMLDSETTVQSTEPWHTQDNYSQPAKLVRSEPSTATSPGTEPLETIERMPNSNRSNPLIIGTVMMLPPANRTYQAPYSPMPPTNIGGSKRYHQSLPGHGFPVSVPQAESSTRNQATHPQDRSASEPTLRMPSSRQPGAHQSPWLISHNDQQQPNESWYHRPPEDQTPTLNQQRGSSAVEDDPHSSSPHMANVFYSTSPGSMGLSHGMDAAYGARRAGPAGSGKLWKGRKKIMIVKTMNGYTHIGSIARLIARFSNQSVGQQQQQQQQHTRGNHPEIYSPIPEPSMRPVDSHSYPRYSTQLAPNQRQAFARPRQSADLYPNVQTFSNPSSVKNTGSSSEQDHMLYRDPYSNNRRAASNVSSFPQAALHSHENHVTQAPHNTVSVSGALEWYDESEKYAQEGPHSHPHIKHGQQLQRQPSQTQLQPQQQQQQQPTSSMYPVSKARMYYSDIPRR